MKTTFKNSKGEFTKENTNYIIEVESSIFKGVITRDGQQNPAIGNKVCAKLTVHIIQRPIMFQARIFQARINEPSPAWSFFAEVGQEADFRFYADTFREAFKIAISEFEIEANKYIALVEQRERALRDAEF